MPPELMALMQRYNRLGTLLPSRDEMDDAFADAAKRAELRLVVAEMRKVKAEIDAFLDEHGKRP